MSVFDDGLIELSDLEYRLFRDFFRETCGLWFGDDSRYLLEKRLARRVRDLGLGSLAAYHHLLRQDREGDQELALVTDELTTNETYFLRERGQLRTLVGEILPELLDARRKAGAGVVSIWSAGCSSGEEPYSIVMLAREAGFEPGRDFRVYASDISRRVLQKARRGVYRPASFRETPLEVQKQYFSEVEGGHRISDDVRRHVVFTHLNLLDKARMAVLGPMDVVLCRNVIIYFDLETKRRVVESFHEKMRPGGYLLLGHSESLINLSSAFELRHLTHDLVYRKPSVTDDPNERWRKAAEAAIAATAGLEGISR